MTILKSLLKSYFPLPSSIPLVCKYKSILGCVFGSMIGDAFGSYWELKLPPKSDEDMKLACEFPRGSVCGRGAGQITDDSEMMMCILSNLSQNKRNTFPLHEICKSYYEWTKTNPPDLGITTKSSLNEFSNIEFKDDDEIFEIINKRDINNSKSLSNGCLMRCNIIGVWYYNESNDIIDRFTKLDTQITHNNEICLEVCSIYNICISEIIKSSEFNDDERINRIITHLIDYCKLNNYNTCLEWIEEGMKNELTINPVEHCGFLKYGFVMSIYCLNQKMDYENSMKFVLKYGGDTDTNCCIVGGIIGCFYNIDNIPEKWIEKVLNSPNNESYLNRGEKYYPSEVIKHLSHLKII